jgi:hypothetical protein
MLIRETPADSIPSLSAWRPIESLRRMWNWQISTASIPKVYLA